MDVAYDGATALDKARRPRMTSSCSTATCPMHGDDVCRTLRSEEPDSRVLMLTAANGVDDLVDGLSLGADDYMPKPFASRSSSRACALARRSGAAHLPTLRSSDVELDPARHTVTRGERPIELTPKEFAVLEALLADGAVAVSNDELVGARLGRERRPVHELRADDRPAAAAQARRPAACRDRQGSRLPRMRLPRPTVRTMRRAHGHLRRRARWPVHRHPAARQLLAPQPPLRPHLSAPLASDAIDEVAFQYFIAFAGVLVLAAVLGWLVSGRCSRRSSA